ncbi:uncharacterized protein LOC127528868 [Erpetoichthys calabaricus]|uniref:uncharacterized protein LOC127528868 n=1 Tax=Erpetoichthys calabaricus TaxID=27687 RepID=UPI0022340C71|nr:uncharacterized protein LOC127528868 [Erpetoichthys calabaricus]
MSLKLAEMTSVEEELVCWGNGALGQCGHGNRTDNEAKDGFLGAFVSKKLGRVMFFSCGSTHSVVVTAENKIFAWGNGNSGQLGNGERGMKCDPTEVFLPPSINNDTTGKEITGLACGGRHTFIWTKGGQVYSFGNNFYAQLGYDFMEENFKEHQVK